MSRDSVWEELMGDKSMVYGEPILDVFLKMTEFLDRKHFDDLTPKQKRIVRPATRLWLVNTPEEAREIVKEGGLDIEEEFRIAAINNKVGLMKILMSIGAKDLDGAMMEAATWGKADAAEFLISSGLKPSDGHLNMAACVIWTGSMNAGGRMEVVVYIIEAWENGLALVTPDGIREAYKNASDMVIKEYLRKKLEGVE